MPGIDVYETSDLPEADQSIHDQPGFDSVDNIDISPSNAFERFKGKSISSKGDSGVLRSEYEILGEGSEVETPEQKYSRLQHEIRELAESISRAKENTKAENAIKGLTPVALEKQVDNLVQMLTELNLEKQLGAAREVNLTDPYGTLHKRLMSEVDQFKSKEIKSPTAKPSPVAAPSAPIDPDHVAYQLFYHPEQTKFDNSARVADLEQRLDRLESLLGATPDKITPLTSELASQSLMSAVSLLTAKAKLMDPGMLDQMDNRLASVSQKLVQLSEKKEILEHHEKLKKVAELYDMVDRWNGYSLSRVVERLATLKELHQKAMEFRHALKQLETAQQQIGGQLKTESELLKQVRTTTESNLTAIQTNYESLASRMKALCETAKS